MTKKTWAALAAASVVVVALIARNSSCNPEDDWPPHEGRIRQTARLSVDGVRRGNTGTVTLEAIAHYTPFSADDARTLPVPDLGKVTLTLVGARGTTPITPTKPWQEVAAGSHRTELVLPEVPDGDYLLRADYETRLGKGTIDVKLPLYTPARIHVLTDRPLYEPGNLVRFRAVALRARDLAPLDARPGRWVVTDPDGEVLLEESSPAGEWGVVAGSFPLDAAAATGTWKVAWVSADAKDEVPFTVEPFTLPRFRVEAEPGAAYYRPKDAPVVKGAVVYSSGAPVAGAAVEITWGVSGDWPPPTAWQEGALPRTAVAGADGRFTLTLPVVPDDLQGQVTLTARLAATDPAGDRVEGRAAVLLAQDGLSVSAVTELGDGLVEGFNNRMYVRVASPDGRVLPATKIMVKRAWQPDDPGIAAETDADGVASLQLDPGPPVNVVIPAKPYRPAPRAAAVRRGDTQELIGGEGASLADQVALDRWLPALASCARFYDDDGDVVVGARVSASGAVTMAAGENDPLARCAAGVIKGLRLPAGAERLYQLELSFGEPDLPSLDTSLETVLDEPENLSSQVADLARGARDCLPRTAEGDLPRALSWSVRAGSKEIVLGPWIDEPGGDDGDGPGAAAALPCVSARFAGARLALDEPAESDALGLIRFSVSPPEAASGDERPQPTTMLGYELLVSADLPGAPSTRLRVAPGTIPDLRLRVTPVLARAGVKVTAELIRGPGFAGTLPKEARLHHRKGDLTEKLDGKTATFTIAPGTEGWCEIQAGGARAVVYVQPDADLAVSVTPGQDRYGPGQQAELTIKTLLGGRGGPAAVGLFGVDESLGQLATLPGPDELARLRPPVETSSPAFGVLDGQALTLGRIRGPHAAAATVLRVSKIPEDAQLDAVISASGESAFDPVQELTDSFYVVLAELHVQVRQWEAKAPPAEQMTPKKLAETWADAVKACQRRGEPVTDAFGRPLRLSRLPADLLALTDPRAVVVVGTRLPEDVENWAAWVQKERP